MDALVDDLIAGVTDDYLGLWQVVDAVKRHNKALGEEGIRQEVLQVLRKLLKSGLVIGNLKSDGGFEPWDDQDPDAATSTVEMEWKNLGHAPEIGEICWFNGYTEPGKLN